MKGSERMSAEINENTIRLISNLIDVKVEDINEALFGKYDEEEFEFDGYSFRELLPCLDDASSGEPQQGAIIRRIVEIAKGKEE